MTKAAGKPEIGRFGVFRRTAMGLVGPEQAVEIEKLGYGAVWAGGSPAADLKFVEPILAVTETLTVATGIVNIWTAAAEPVAESYHRIEQAYPERFLLGIGAGHAEFIQQYRKPYEALVDYLDELDSSRVPSSRRLLAALGPRVLKLAADRSAGAHPYLTTPKHTAQAREIIGHSALLVPEHKVVLSTDADQARAIGREALDVYFDLRNWTNNWKRLGFTDDDVARPGSDRLIDALVAHGSSEQIARQLTEHLDAGADHVAVQVLAPLEELVPALAELAGPLGL
jgi:probable F420-dependent oxidoreductase